MLFNFENLDSVTRKFMLEEVDLVWCRINYLTFGYLYGIIYA